MWKNEMDDVDKAHVTKRADGERPPPLRWMEPMSDRKESEWMRMDPPLFYYQECPFCDAIEGLL